MSSISTWFLRIYRRTVQSQNLERRERGDVPGWVMITLMTAALVVLLWTTVGPALTSLFEDAISRVTNIS
ncbi:hypothetical protein NG665_06065 [Arcanobacterium pinnipediorum]|uniref:Flp pilus assembly protein, pilin Flp n=1 Tax=Arcanobacterium pinnipediorum TaxID=1503041 RepID=A0ABY5AG29_9ACTO|nr:hypothetical protein [Arcanobacterium pinnipediorum]USR78955.1 hypothetical protein NG665_06065 [Arcanobacterium pinnipediorum]